MFLQTTKQLFIFAIFFLLLATYARTQQIGQAELVYQWNEVDLEWPCEDDKEAAIQNGSFVPERNLVVGIKVYKDDVYVTIPRWFWTSGQPVTLAKVVKVNNRTKLRPFPNWAAQNQNNCRAFQFVMSMEIDPNTGLMYIIDTGRVGNSLNLCPAKIVVYDLNRNRQVGFYELPDRVVRRTKNFLNDIVLDYVDGKVRYAYMSDAYDSRLIIYDFKKRRSHYLKHSSMDIERNNNSVIHFNGKDYDYILSNINGITMSPDFKFVYYCPVSTYSLYQIPTSVLRRVTRATATGIRRLGEKVSQTGAIIHGSKRLYYGALGLNAVYYWDVQKDMANQRADRSNVTLATQVELVRNDTGMQWPDTFALDTKGWLWFTADRLPLFWAKGIPKSTEYQGSFMAVWKVFVNETSYLYQADRWTRRGRRYGL